MNVVNGRIRLPPALALALPLALPLLLLAGVAAAAAQPAATAASTAEDQLPRLDTFGFIGWRGTRYESSYFSSGEWDARFVAGGTFGYYWTPNIKFELDASGTSPSRFDEYVERPVPGQTFPSFYRSEHRVVTATLGGTVIYQFYENASFHPFLGAGAGVITTRDRIETERQTQTIRPTPNGPMETIVLAEAESRKRTDHHGRGLIVAGFKAYPGERVFFRTDVQWSTAPARDITWRIGAGVDF